MGTNVYKPQYRHRCLLYEHTYQVVRGDASRVMDASVCRVVSWLGCLLFMGRCQMVRRNPRKAEIRSVWVGCGSAARSARWAFRQVSERPSAASG